MFYSPIESWFTLVIVARVNADIWAAILNDAEATEDVGEEIYFDQLTFCI